jgi:5-methyltetrahydrofolate--homocysteine methyltransferase
LVVPALTAIGDEYEAQRAFLPQLLLAAEAAHSAFAVLEPLLAADGPAVERGKVILATVRGDMHDIGKNIIALLLRSHGFQVIDLGRDVAAERVIEAARVEHPAVIGLSALMTTTMTEMGTVMQLLAAAGIKVPVIVGGAVLNAEYAAEIGAEYAPDAVSGVRRIGELATIRS